MKIEEALEYLSESGIEHKIDDPFADTHNDSLLLAMEALEKQIPKKLKREFNGIEGLEICECGGEAYTYPRSFKCCPYCGQAIDWEV